MKYVTSLGLLLYFTSICAQEIQLSGILTDVQTNEPLPYAHVGVMGTSVGSVTNSQGEFSVIIPESLASGSLSFSYLGYSTFSTPISSISDHDNMIVGLVPQSIQLQDLVINVKKKSLIEEAIERIPENHDQGDMRLSGFWRAQIQNSKKHIQLSETAFDIFRLDKKDILQITKARACRDTSAFDQFKGFNAGISPKSLFTNSFLIDMNILSKKYRKEHDYELVDATIYNDRPVLVVEFDRKKSSKENGHKGTILLDAETLAFVKIKFGFSPSNPNEIQLFDSWVLKKLSGLGYSTWGKYESEFNFQHVDGKWYLRNGVYDVEWKLVDNDQSFSEPVKYYGDLVITNISKEDIVLPEKDERASRGILVNQSTTNNSNFWKGYNYIVPDQDFDEIFRQIEELNKSYEPEED